MRIPKILHNHPLFWGLILTPIVITWNGLASGQKTLLFFMSLLAIVPLAAALSYATEHIAERLGNASGGLLNATMGNMTELIICLTAIRAGLFDVVKATLAGVVVTNCLFALGVSFLAGGMRHHIQKLNMDYVHMQAGLLLLATIALFVPSMLHVLPVPDIDQALQPMSAALSVVLVCVYMLSLHFTLVTHSEVFNRRKSLPARKDNGFPFFVHVTVLAVATVAIALVSDIFVGTLSDVTVTLNLSQAFVGFVLVALAGGAAEMYSAIHAAQQNRSELSVAIALGSSSQVTLFIAPVLVFLSYFLSPTPMNLQFSGPAVLMVLLSTLSITTIVSSRHTTWYTGILLMSIYSVFAITLYLVRFDQ